MSETRSTRSRGKAKARAAAATTSEPTTRASGREATAGAAAPVVAVQTKAKSGGGKKQTKKTATSVPVVVLPPAPSSPSPQKKKKRKRLHKRKNSGADLDVDADEDLPSEPVEQKAAPTPKPKAKEATGGETALAKKKKMQATKEPESSPPLAPEEAPAPADKRAGKRKNRSGSIGGHEEETGPTTKAEARQVSVVSTKQGRKAVVEKVPKARTTRAARVAAATAATESKDDREAISVSTLQETAPETTSKAKKKRKTKASRSVSTDTPSEPMPEPESRTPHSHSVPVRKSPRLAHEDITEEEPRQLIPVKPVRKIVSLAKVKGKAPQQDTRRNKAAVEGSQQGDEQESKSDVAEEITGTPPPADALQDSVVEETGGAETALNTMDVEVGMEVEAPTEPTQNVGETTGVGEILDPMEAQEELDCLRDETGDESARAMTEADQPSVEETQAGAERFEEAMAVEEDAEENDALPDGPHLLSLDSFAEAEMLEECLEYHTGPTSSVESVLGDFSEQALDSENDEQDFASREPSEQDEEDPNDEEITDVREDDSEVGDAPMDAEAASQGSIDGSEAFTLEEDVQDDDEAEYASLGVSSQTLMTERETAVDLDDEGDLDEGGGDQETKREEDETDFGSFAPEAPVDSGRNDGSVVVDRESATTEDLGEQADLGELDDDDSRVSLPPTIPLASFHPHGHARETQEDEESSGDDEEEHFGSYSADATVDGGLNESFVDEEEVRDDWTGSDDEEGFVSEAETAIIDELPGLQSSGSSNAPAVDEVIVLSDTDSDEEGESSGPGAVHVNERRVDVGPNEEADDEAAFEQSTAASATRNFYDEGEMGQASREDAGIEASYADDQMEQDEEDEPKERSEDDTRETTCTEGAVADPVQDEVDENQDDELVAEHPSLSDHDESSGNESERTFELYGEQEEESHRDATSMEGDTTDAFREEATDEEEAEGQLGGVEEQVQRTLFTQLGAAHTAPPASATLLEEAPTKPASLPPTAPPTVPTRSNVDGITYRTIPSKHLIDSVLSASREQALARVTDTATTAPLRSSKRSTAEQTWGLSFGVSASPDALATAADDAGQAVLSPLSSWFFSRGPANFKKRVLIPSPSSPRQRLGSPRPLKMMRVEGADTGLATSLSGQSENNTDRFMQNLMDSSAWRSWYSKTKPDELLDAPLPVAMVKRLGGDAALALLSHPSVKPSSPFPEQVQAAVAVPKKRRLALAQLEASIQEEKKRTKAFDAELLQLLQGKTLSGKDLAEEFAPLLPPSSSQR